MELHLKILDKERLDILPLFNAFSKEEFYLAGGTGLALQIGHRDSIDFDFFKEGDFDTKILISKIESIFVGHKISITSEEKNTVSWVIDERIQVSFFGYHHRLQKPLIETKYFNIASIEDIACMKFSAITGRSVEKDYVDLYFIFQKFSLSELLEIFKIKYPTLDIALILKSLVYFDDIEKEHIVFKEGHDVSFETIKEYLQKLVSGYLLE